MSSPWKFDIAFANETVALMPLNEDPVSFGKLVFTVRADIRADPLRIVVHICLDELRGNRPTICVCTESFAADVSALSRVNDVQWQAMAWTGCIFELHRRPLLVIRSTLVNINGNTVWSFSIDDYQSFKQHQDSIYPAFDIETRAAILE